MKKKIVGFLCFVILLSLLGGCAAKNDNVSNDTTEETTGTVDETESKEEPEQSGKESVNLIVWGGVPAENGPQDLVDAWNEENPDIQVEYVRFVNDETGNVKLDTALLSGEQIDLFFTYGVDILKKRADSGMMEPLESFGAMEFIEQELIGEGKSGLTYIDETLFAIPTITEPLGILINQSMLQEAGLTIPENWTLDDFREIATKLTNKSSDPTVYGANIIEGGNPFTIQRAVLGGNYLYKNESESNFDNPLFELNLTLKEMMDEGILMPFEEVFSRDLSVYAHPAFLNEEFAMFPGSIWHFRYINDMENFPHDFKVEFAPIPRPDANTENPYQSILANYISMNSESDYKEEAWKFMQYWLTEGSLYMLPGGKMTAWKNADQDAVVEGLLGENAEERYDIDSFKKVMLNPDLQYVVDTITIAYPQISQIYKEENENLFLGSTNPKDYTSILKQRADEAIKAAK